MHQAHRAPDKSAQPVGRGIASVRHTQGVAPNGHAAQIRVGIGHLDLQRRSPRSAERQPAASVPERRELAHFWIGALGQKTPGGFVHQHPASITHHTQRVQPHLRQAFTLAGLERETINRT